MNTNLQNHTDGSSETTAASTAAGDLTAILELLATAGLAVEALFDGSAERCPHCLFRVLSEAA